MFPFSFWGADAFQGITQTLELNEDFTGWFAQWNTVVQTLEFGETFATFFDAEWAPVVEALEFFEDFTSW